MSANNKNYSNKHPVRENEDNRTGESRHADQQQEKGKKQHFRGRNNPGRKKHNDKRAQDMRERKGNEYQDEYTQKIKEKWLPGIETAEKLEARLKEVANQKAQMLSITTRGVGVNLLTSIFTTTAYQKDIMTPNLYSLYRLSLAVLEAKMQSLKAAYPIPPRFSEFSENLNNSADFERICRSVVFLPKPIVMMVNAVGVYKNGNSIYIPVFNADYTDANGIFVPTPENVRYGNLRKTVVALADAATPLAYRESFHARNPIPGAKWSEQHILLNADEIMPANHSNESLARDGILITPWMSSVQKHVPRLVGPTISFETTGRKSILICNDQETLKLPDRGLDESLNDYFSRAIPEGNIRTFHSPCHHNGIPPI